MGNCFPNCEHTNIQSFILDENNIKLILQISNSNKKFDDVKKSLAKPEDEKELENLKIIMDQNYLNGPFSSSNPPLFFNSDVKDINNMYSQYGNNRLKISNLKIGSGWTAYNKDTLKKMFEMVDYSLSKNIFLTDKKSGVIWYINNLDINNILIYKFQMKTSSFFQFENGFYLAHEKFYEQSA